MGCNDSLHLWGGCPETGHPPVGVRLGAFRSFAKGFPGSRWKGVSPVDSLAAPAKALPYGNTCGRRRAPTGGISYHPVKKSHTVRRFGSVVGFRKWQVYHREGGRYYRLPSRAPGRGGSWCPWRVSRFTTPPPREGYRVSLYPLPFPRNWGKVRRHIEGVVFHDTLWSPPQKSAPSMACGQYPWGWSAAPGDYRAAACNRLASTVCE